MARSFYSNDQTPTLPGLPETSRDEHVLPETTPITESHKSLKPQSPIFINQLGSQITTSPALEAIASNIRETTTEYYESINEKWEFYTSIAASHWGMTVDRTKAIVSPNDNFLPNSLYVLSATLLGSIITRNRSLPLRFTTPWIFGAISLKFALPGTYDNLTSSISQKYLQLEQSKMPELKKAREESLNGLSEFQKSAESGKESAWAGLVATVHNAREQVCDLMSSKK